MTGIFEGGSVGVGVWRWQVEAGVLEGQDRAVTEI